MSVYVIDRSRGRKVVRDVLGKSYTGVLHTDFYGSYNEIECEKQKCWAHLLRLKTFFARGVALRDSKIQSEDIKKSLARLVSDTQNFMFRRFRHPKLKTLAKRMIKFRANLYTFVEHGNEPTNNNAEREIRPAVLMRKTSYGNRSTSGASNQAILMSIIRTCHKQNINFVNFATNHLRRS